MTRTYDVYDLIVILVWRSSCERAHYWVSSKFTSVPTQEDKPETRENYMSSTLVIMRFDTPLEGEYTCIASNVFRMKKKSITITGQCVASLWLSHTSDVRSSYG